LLALLALALVEPGVRASAGDNVKTFADLQIALRQDGLIPRAFVRNEHMRLYFTNDHQQLMFKAAWKRPRVSSQDFSYTGAMLEGDDSPPAVPTGKSDWREVKVLAGGEAERFVRTAAGRLAPVEPNHAAHFQLAVGDVLLLRDSTGQIKLVRFEELPAGMTIDRRLGRHEFASALAKAMEEELRATYPNDTQFVMMLARGRESRVVFLDLETRESVMLYAPRPSNDPRRVAKLATTTSTLASFLIVDNAWAFLKNPVSSATRTLNQGLQWTATLFDPRLRESNSPVPPLTNGPGMPLAQWEQWLDKHTATSRERGTVRLLINGEKFYPAFERRVAEAQHSVNIHVCIFDRDDVGLSMADLLKSRSTNVEVKVVFDRINSRGAGKAPPATPMPDGFVPPNKIGAYLRSGSEVHVRPMLNPGFTADHSKVYLIDGRYAYLGGMNLGREYRYEWHDLMAEVEGPVVASLQKQFNKKWAQGGIWGDCALATESLCGESVPPAEPAADSIELRRLYTKTFDRQIRRAELAAIRQARNCIYIENPYIYDNEIIVALARARRRGVDVRVVMPAENDLAPGQGSNLVTGNYLLTHGVRVYFYPGMTHVKALLADGWVCFGSANFDALSLRLNREADLASSDPGFSKRFKQEVFETDFAKSRELKEAMSVDWGDHVADSFLNLF
jgi:phosphatidylserine/phosphatidylglycerophosphate/cardiolipin synthase-like enzyme